MPQPPAAVEKADQGNGHVSQNDRDREHDEVDQERKHPPRQHAAKQFRLRERIEGMRLIIRTAAAPGAAAAVTRTAVRHDPSSATVPSPRETWEWVAPVARACPANYARRLFCHSGMVRRTRPQMCNCTSGNLEIPGSRLRRAPE